MRAYATIRWPLHSEYIWVKRIFFPQAHMDVLHLKYIIILAMFVKVRFQAPAGSFNMSLCLSVCLSVNHKLSQILLAYIWGPYRQYSSLVCTISNRVALSCLQYRFCFLRYESNVLIIWIRTFQIFKLDLALRCGKMFRHSHRLAFANDNIKSAATYIRGPYWQ